MPQSGSVKENLQQSSPGLVAGGANMLWRFVSGPRGRRAAIIPETVGRCEVGRALVRP